jgi:hypothetical protein
MPMSTPLEDYKQFIDAIAALGPNVNARWVREKTDWPKLPENRSINRFLATLSDEQREVLAGLLDHSYDAGIHRLLAYLNDEIALAGLAITRNGRELPAQPFGSELYYDWVCRKAGDEWPDPIDEETA